MIDQIIANVGQLDLLVNHLYSLERVQDRFEPGLHITVKPFKGTRTSAQNRLMWMWNNQIAMHIRENSAFEEATKDDVHEYLVERWYPMKINPLTKKEKRADTHKFSPEEMTAHLERMEFFCGKKGIPITHPADYDLAMKG